MEEETGFKIKIIIPSFNEEKNIIKLVDSLNVTTNKINNIKFDYLFIDSTLDFLLTLVPAPNL